MRFRATLLLVIALAVFAGCTQNDVDLVKNGYMQAYPTTTVGSAFDATFNAPKWTSFKGEKGQRIVEFTGTIPKGLHDEQVQYITSEFAKLHSGYATEYAKKILTEAEFQETWEAFSEGGERSYYDVERDVLESACDQKIWPVGAEVAFQWIVSPNGKDFQLAYIEDKAWGADFKDDHTLTAIFE